VVIDDDLEMLVLVHTVLSRSYEVATCNDPNQALEFIQQTEPHLILLDLMMPEHVGWGIYNEIRRGERTQDTPVIIVTASHESVDRVFALNIAHVAAYLTKPFNPDELRRSVAKALESQPPDLA
jgi:DNA-binding response OmpR family regulator